MLAYPEYVIHGYEPTPQFQAPPRGAGDGTSTSTKQSSRLRFRRSQQDTTVACACMPPWDCLSNQPSSQ